MLEVTDRVWSSLCNKLYAEINSPVNADWYANIPGIWIFKESLETKTIENESEILHVSTVIMELAKSLSLPGAGQEMHY